MRRTVCGDPALVTYRTGAAGKLILGGMVMAMGGGVLAVSSRLPPVVQERWVLRAVGIVLLGGGAAASLARSGLDIDLRERTYRRWWGLLGPWRVRRGSLGDLNHVFLNRVARRTKQGTFVVYPVSLVGKGKAGGLRPVRIRIEAPGTPAQARKSAEDLAQATGLTLVDASLGVVRVVAAAHLHESLRDRVRRLGGLARAPSDPPPGLLTACSTSGRTVRLDIPPRGTLLRSLRTAWTVEASPQRLRIEERSPMGRRGRELTCDSVRDVVVSPGGAIVVLTADEMLSFGGHLPAGEKQWIRDVLEAALSA